MAKLYLATEQEISDMIDHFDDIHVDLELLDEAGVDSLELDVYDYMLHRLSLIYHKHIAEFPEDKVWLQFTLEVIGGGQSEVKTDLIESFDADSPYFICNELMVGDYGDYIISMFVELPDTKSELAKRTLDTGGM